MSTKKTPPNSIEALFAEAVEAVESIEKKHPDDDIEIIFESSDTENDEEGIEIELDMSEFGAQDSEAHSEESPSPQTAHNIDIDAILEELEEAKLRILDLEGSYATQEAQLIKAKKIIVKRKAENERLKNQLEFSQKELIQHRMLLQNAQTRIETTNRRLSDAEIARDQSSSRVMQLQAALDQSNERLSKEQLLRSKENEENRRFGGLKVMRSLLPALDNLQLALKHQEGNVETFASGIEMVEKQMLGILSNLGLNSVQAEQTQVFDPNIHEAMLSVPSTEHAPNTIVEVIRSGYTLHDRLVRAARVSVAVTPPQESTELVNAEAEPTVEGIPTATDESSVEAVGTLENEDTTSSEANAPIATEENTLENDGLSTETEILLSSESPPVVE